MDLILVRCKPVSGIIDLEQTHPSISQDRIEEIEEVIGTPTNIKDYFKDDFLKNIRLGRYQTLVYKIQRKEYPFPTFLFLFQSGFIIEKLILNDITTDKAVEVFGNRPNYRVINQVKEIVKFSYTSKNL
ncbi:MAG: hypothetical protein ACXAD7_11470, partial [Candidatus Kariarchaeaceae archaeon]